jgi:hypothetical protein
MPVASTAYAPLPDVQLIKRRPISVAECAQKMREFVNSEIAFRAEHDPAGVNTLASERFNQVCVTEAPRILQCIESDWVGHQDIDLLDCFVRIEARIEVHLNPCFLGEKLQNGLRKAVGDILLRYSRVLGCMPLTVTELQPLGPPGNRFGAVVGCGPFVHFLASFNSVGFQPRLNSWILGRFASAQVPTGVNIKVLELLNVFVRRAGPNFPSNLRYDAENAAWCRGADPLNERYLVILKLTSKKRENVGEIGIQLEGHIESTDHIKKKKAPKDRASTSSTMMSSPPTEVKKKRKSLTAVESPPGASSGVPNGVEDFHSKPEDAVAEPTPKKKKKLREEHASSPKT